MLEYLREFGNRSRNPVDRAIGKMAEAGLIARREKDIPFPVQTSAVKTEKTSTSKDPLKQRIAEYRIGPLTPELVTNYWRVKLPELVIPDCDWTAEEIQRPMVDREGNTVPGLMVPDLGEITLPILGRMYPKMGSRTVKEDTPITDIHNTRGWVKVYASIDAPNSNITKTDAEKFAEDQGYLGQREKTYILASQASKDLAGHYLDEGVTWSWLPGSRCGGKLVSARFDPGGGLYVGWSLDPGGPDPDEGWRFEEVRKT